MSILDMFKGKKEEKVVTTDTEVSQDKESDVVAKKPKHGEDGVCCGGCH